MCNEKIINYDFAPAKKTDKLMQDLDKEKRVMLNGLLTINSKGEIKLFGFTFWKGKEHE